MSIKEIRRGYQIWSVFCAYRLDELLDGDLFSDINSSSSSDAPSRAASKTPKAINRLPKRMRQTTFWISSKTKDLPVGERLRLALQELGPVWIKLGQMLSTRRDLLPDHLADPLALLQDKVSPFDGELAIQEIEAALGDGISTWFDDVDTTPLASASIAQVHTATLKSNRLPVVIKVIRPDIEKSIEADLALMHQGASLLSHWVKDSQRFRFKEVVTEYEKTLLAELDLRIEAANAIQLRYNFSNSSDLYVPEVYSDFTRRNIMVSERIDGIMISDIAALHAQGTDMKRLAEKGVTVFFTQAFQDSFFHADMHPGNVFVSKQTPSDPMWIALDCGIVGKLEPSDQRYLAKNLLAFFNRDYRKVAVLHVQSGWVPQDTDLDAFTHELERVCDPMFNKPLGEISFGLVLLELFKIARQFKMDVQPQLVLLQKTLLYIEGLGRQLYPQLDLWTTAKPFLENWMNEQIGAKAIYKTLKEKAPEWGEKLPELPELIFDALEKNRDLEEKATRYFQQYCENKRKQTSGFFLFGMGATALICSAILFSQSTLGLAWVSGLAIAGGAFLLASWIKLTKI